jgi:phage baseplate assembly protein gpV
VQFTDDGMTLVSPGTITIRAPSIVFEGDVRWVGNEGGGRGTMTINMDIAQTGTITSNGAHIDNTHIHGGVQSGGSLTTPPAN